MMKAHARVIAVDGDHVLLQASAATGCGACAMQRGCATSRLGRLLQPHAATWRIANPLRAQVGDEVTLGLPDDALLAAAAMAYLPPLAGLVAGALIAAGLSTSPSWPAAGALLGMAAGVALTRLLLRGRRTRYAPRMLARTPGAAVARIRFRDIA
jgi:sigma-E factor negative regulatory protein RseC